MIHQSYIFKFRTIIYITIRQPHRFEQMQDQMKNDLKSDLKNYGSIPFLANLTHFGPEVAISGATLQAYQGCQNLASKLVRLAQNGQAKMY